MLNEIRLVSMQGEGEMLSTYQSSLIHALGDTLISAIGLPGARCWDYRNQ